MPWGKTWTLVLRCYKCSGKFTFRQLTMDIVSVMPITTPCPHCGARPDIGSHETKLHGISDLRELENCFRKPAAEETWHFSEDCAKWPTENYVELDMSPKGEICNECKVKKSSGDDYDS